jgi:hypothetical protein
MKKAEAQGYGKTALDYNKITLMNVFIVAKFK